MDDILDPEACEMHDKKETNQMIQILEKRSCRRLEHK